MNCNNCRKVTSNSKFCSRSCSASYNNKIPKRKVLVKNLCTKCSKRLSRYQKSRASSFCKACQYDSKVAEYSKKTLKEVCIEGLNRASRHKYELVRQHSKRVAKMYNIQKTCKCGYSIHTELCHIKPISSFSDDDLLSTINSVKNLVYLCPTCHWELDNL